ncbi:MAG: hypothetical protein WAN64_17345, partial [Pseudolabrys sp.]
PDFIGAEQGRLAAVSSRECSFTRAVVSAPWASVFLQSSAKRLPGAPNQLPAPFRRRDFL